jgi:gas vesicle protein
MMTRDHKVGAILTFGLGAALGAVAALLFAPKAGEELRGDIAAGFRNGVNHVHGTGKHLKRRAKKVVALTQDNVQDAIVAGDKTYGQAKKA